MDTNQITLLIAVIGAASGLLGAVLGIINILQVLDSSKVKLKVLPRIASLVSDTGELSEHEVLCIEVINLSSFPVTVEEAGVLYKGTNHRRILCPPIIYDGKQFPRRLEPRESVSLYSNHNGVRELIQKNFKCVFAKTACGVVSEGKNSNLKTLVFGA